MKKVVKKAVKKAVKKVAKKHSPKQICFNAFDFHIKKLAKLAKQNKTSVSDICRRAIEAI